MMKTTPDQADAVVPETKERVVIATLEDDVLIGPLDDVIEFLVQLKQKFGQDYRGLAVEPDNLLSGVRNYSDATRDKMQQLRELIQQLPEEATNEILRSYAENPDG